MTEAPAVRFDHACLRLGAKTLWEEMSLTVRPGEFLTVIGPNGAGKTSLLRVLLGLQPLTLGTVEIHGRVPRHGTAAIGYVPQQRAFDPDVRVRGRDLVALGVDGHQWGPALPSRAVRRRVDAVLALVGAAQHAETPVGRLSGGEQQRLRIAQALVGAPQMLLCDEPLLSLDLHSQRAIVDLIAQWNRRHGGTVVFVTHDINPVLIALDRVLLLASGRWAVGRPDEVLTAPTLTRLYGAPVDVLHVEGRVVILGAELGGHDPIPAPPPATP